MYWKDGHFVNVDLTDVVHIMINTKESNLYRVWLHGQPTNRFIASEVLNDEIK